MGKVILEFDLIEERIEYLQALQSGKAYSAINEILNYLRRKYKHKEPKSQAHRDEFSSIEKDIREIISDEEVYFELL